MRIEQINKYLDFVDPKWYITDNGDVYVRLKKYSKSYRMIIGYNKDGHRKYKSITKEINEFKSNIYPCYFKKPNIILLEGKIPLEIRYYKPNKDGYKVFNCKGSRPIGIHRLVGLIFNNIPMELSVHHIDRNKLNNNHTNLVGLTNIEHTKLHAHDKRYHPERRKSKYKSFVLIEPKGIKHLYTDTHKACEDFNIPFSCLCNILSGNRNHYRGFRVEDIVLNE